MIWYNERMEHRTSTRIIRLPEVIGATQLSRSTIYRLLGSGAFPRPMKLSERAIGWRWDEVEAWLSTRERTGMERLVADMRTWPPAATARLPPLRS